MERTKKQHYISQSILKKFFDTDKIKEYNLLTNKNYGISTENSMCCSDIYECDIFDDNRLEAAFAALYDGQFATAMDNINKSLYEDRIEDAILLLKKNYYYYMVSYYKSLASLIRLSANDENKLDKNISTKKMFDFITDVKYMNQLSLILTNCYKIYFLESDNSNFILSDQFISTASNHFNGVFSNISNRDIGVKGSMLFLPISKDYYALLGDKNFNFEYDELKINKLSQIQTKKINNIIYNNATEKVATIREYNYDFSNINSCGDESCFIVYNTNTRGWKKKKEIFYSEYEQNIYDMFLQFEWSHHKDLGKNNLCYCNSGKKYKKCCYDKTKRCFLIMHNIRNKSLNDSIPISSFLGIEKTIEL